MTRASIRERFLRLLPDEVARFEEELASCSRPQTFGLAAFKSGLLFGGMIGDASSAEPLLDLAVAFFERCEDRYRYDGARPTPENLLLAKFESLVASFTLDAMQRGMHNCTELNGARDVLKSVLSRDLIARSSRHESAAIYLLQAVAVNRISLSVGCQTDAAMETLLEVDVTPAWISLWSALRMKPTSSSKAVAAFDHAYRETFRSANYDSSLVAGMPVLPMYLLSLTRTPLDARRALEEMLAD